MRARPATSSTACWCRASQAIRQQTRHGGAPRPSRLTMTALGPLTRRFSAIEGERRAEAAAGPARQALVGAGRHPAGRPASPDRPAPLAVLDQSPLVALADGRDGPRRDPARAARVPDAGAAARLLRARHAGAAQARPPSSPSASARAGTSSAPSACPASGSSWWRTPSRRAWHRSRTRPSSTRSGRATASASGSCSTSGPTTSART